MFASQRHGGMPKKKGQSEWLLEKIKFLADCGEKFQDSLTTIEYGPHTILKLICAHYYAEMFAKIAKGQSARSRGYDGAIYLDLFAGPGIVRIRGSGDRLAGSPLAVTNATMPKTPFDYSIFVETNPERSHALKRRLGSYLSANDFVVVEGDCNSHIDAIIKYVEDRWKRPIVLTFVDPEGMEAKWRTIRVLSKYLPNIDFMITLTSGLDRVAGRLASGMEGDRPIFEDFFGKDAESVLVRSTQGEPVQKQYELGIKEVLGKPMGATIPIQDTHGRLAYQFLGYTRLSWTGSPWAIGFKTLRDRLAGVNGALALETLNVVKGRQKTLSF